MNHEQRSAIEQSCTRLLISFSNLNDAGKHEELVQLFTENGGFARPSDPDTYDVGRESILATFKARPRDRITRHLLSNILIDVDDDNDQSARGKCYVLLFSGSPENKAPEFGLLANPSQLIGEFDADFAITDEGWKISRLTGDIIFST